MSSTTPSALIETLSGHVRKSVAKRLRPSETVKVTLRGASSSALVCTDQRVLIVKIGFMTDWFWGAQIFETTPGAVADLVIRKDADAGYCDIVTDGHWAVSKSFWDYDCDHPKGRVAPNRLALISWSDATRFQQARDTILQLAAAARPPQPDPLDRSAA